MEGWRAGKQREKKEKEEWEKREVIDDRLTEENPDPDHELVENQQEMDLDEAETGSRRVEN
jgi:hypothetical protein